MRLFGRLFDTGFLISIVQQVIATVAFIHDAGLCHGGELFCLPLGFLFSLTMGRIVIHNHSNMLTLY